ncbi:hypothetical protein AOA12_06275 [Microbacterium sp. No. 7]|nr:hypothetical protein AOA12_06275 [Microbacterium sp. No. 7]
MLMRCTDPWCDLPRDHAEPHARWAEDAQRWTAIPRDAARRLADEAQHLLDLTAEQAERFQECAERELGGILAAEREPVR